MVQIEYLGYRFKLRLKKKQIELLAQFAGCSRFIYNALLNRQNELFADYINEIDLRRSFGEAFSLAEAQKMEPRSPYPSRENLINAIKIFKEDPEYSFLNDCYSQVLQQSAIDLSRAFKNYLKQFEDSKKKSTDSKKRENLVLLNLRRSIFMTLLEFLNILSLMKRRRGFIYLRLVG